VDAVLENIRVSKEEVSQLVTAQTQEKAKKEQEVARLNSTASQPTIMTGPTARPTEKVKTAAELREQLQANIDVDRFLAEQDSWIPGATSEA
jgi:hypothetical protein